MSQRILVVEDNKNNLTLLIKLLAKKGYLPEGAKDGLEGYEKFKAGEYALVLLDLFLPKMMGFEVAEKIRAEEKGKETPIVIMSGVYKTKDHVAQAREKFGVRHFLSKPFTSSALITAIQDSLAPPKGDGGQPAGTAPAAPPKPEAPKADEGGEGAAPAPPPGGAPPPAETQAAPVGEAEAAAARERAAPDGEEDLDKVREQGKIEANFPEIFFRLYSEFFNGILTVRNREVKKDLYFINGMLVYVNSNLRSEHLGRFLVKRGVLTEEKHIEISRLAEQKRLQYGKAAIELGTLDSTGLYREICHQIEEKVIHCFGWEEGDFLVREDPSQVEGVTVFDVSLLDVCREGIDKHYDMNRISAVMEPFHDKFPHKSPNFDAALSWMELRDEEVEFYKALDGQKTVASHISEMGNLEKSLKLLYQFHLLRLVTFVDEPAAADEDDFEIQFTLDFGMDEGEVDADLERMVMDSYLKIMSQNHYEILGVKRKADKMAIEKAYFAMMSKFHPDNYFNKISGSVFKKIEEIFSRITLAYNLLSDAKARSEYDIFLAESGSVSAASAEAASEAEVCCIEGERLLIQGKYQDAFRAFHRASRLNPGEPEYQAYLGFVIFLEARRRKEPIPPRSKEILEKVLASRTRNDKALILLALVLLSEGWGGIARRYIREALELNANCLDDLKKLNIPGFDLDALAAEARPTGVFI